MTLKLVSRREQIALISAAIDAYGDGITILEAGCGRAWPLKLSIDYTLVGLDLDEDALRLRIEQQKDLDDYRVGDLRDDAFPPQSFDVIYCSYVLEHVEGVEKVLDNFARWIRPGGLIVLRIPDKDSVYALLARTTPHWFHVLFCKYVNRHRDAGKPGHAPYPVVYEDAMSRRGIEAFCAAHGYSPSVTAAAAYKRSWFKPLAFLVSASTFGRYAWRHNNLTYLITAGSAASARAERRSDERRPRAAVG
ncbi:MAG: class I SAM-dependent methyltransferase [Gammaproteobacteria bacterium]|nr:class I SAM-dependent methyltransferase [Gammaproteobacteria bacterium]